MRKLFLILFSLFLVSAKAQMSGSYTVSGHPSDNPDYPSISAAIQALASAGMSGQVVLEIAAGTYEEFVTIPQITGAANASRVILRGMGGDSQQVVLTSNAGYAANNTVTLNGADHISFENLTIATTSSNYCNLVYLKNGVDDVVFDNVRFVGVDTMTATYSDDKHLVYDSSGEWNDHDLHFTNCSFVNGYIALYLQGRNMNTPKDSGLIVENCSFTNQYAKSIYCTFQENVVIRGNVINNEKDLKNGYQGIDGYRCNGLVCENNVVNINYSSCYATGIEFRPATGTLENPVYVRNNIVNMHSDANYSYCFIFSKDDTDYCYFAHNTAKITGSGSCGNVLVENSFDHFYMYNNLFVNETSGYVVRIQNANTEGRFSDYNRVSYVGSNFGRLGTVDYADVNAWSSATGFDAHSAVIAPSFVSNSNLHLTSAVGMTVANPLVYVATDIDGENRSNVPCAGADEYASTNLPPVVANPIADVVFENYPESQEVDLQNVFTDPDDPDENIVVSVVSNSNPLMVGVSVGNGKLHLVRISESAGSALITLKAESNGQQVQTSFSVLCHVEDLPPVVVNPLEPIVFDSYPQQFGIDLNNVFDDPDNDNAMMQFSVVACPEEIIANVDGFYLTVIRQQLDGFDNKVLTIRAMSNGKTVDLDISVSGMFVVIDVAVADFEDVSLNSSGLWQTPQSGFNTLTSSGWEFTNYYDPTFWGGFTVSNRSDLTLSGIDAQYTAVPGIGCHESSNYAVAYTYGAQCQVSSADGQSRQVTGCYVTNNLWAYQSITEGDALSLPFGGETGNDPDYFLLNAVGINENGVAFDTVVFYLADYRFADNSKDYVVSDWQWLDLSSLGEVSAVSFSLESSVGNDWGMLTPSYFCLDNFNGEVPDTKVDEVFPELNMYPNPTSGEITIAMEERVSAFEITVFDVMGQMLFRQHVNGNNANVTLAGLSKGVYFVRVDSEKGMAMRKVVVK